MSEKEDIRWVNIGTGKRITYKETLAAEIKHKNRWITKGEWSRIEHAFESMTEEDAENKCRWINKEVRDCIEHHHRIYD